MKVAHIHWSLMFGGIETMLVNIANEQVAQGADVSIIIINDIAEESLKAALCPEIHLINLGRKKGSKDYRFIWKLDRALRHINPDAIHVHSSRIWGFILRKRFSRVASLTLHDLPLGKVRRKGLLPRLFPILNSGIYSNTIDIDRYPRVFAISKAVHDELLEHYSIPSYVIPNGIISKSFGVRPHERNLGQHMKIIMVSRLDHEKKGQDLLIQAATQLPNVYIDFIGEGLSRDYLQNLITEAKLADRVRLLGKRDQTYIREHLRDYDLFVQPSRREGFGLTVAEAMAAQVPVLVSEGQGPAEVTCDDKYGWVFENSNIKDLADKITYISDNYQESLQKAIIGRQYVIDTYDVAVTAKEYLRHYLD